MHHPCFKQLKNRILYVLWDSINLKSRNSKLNGPTSSLLYS